MKHTLFANKATELEQDSREIYYNFVPISWEKSHLTVYAEKVIIIENSVADMHFNIYVCLLSLQFSHYSYIFDCTSAYKCNKKMSNKLSNVYCGHKNINLHTDEYHETKFNGFWRSMWWFVSFGFNFYEKINIIFRIVLEIAVVLYRFNVQ